MIKQIEQNWKKVRAGELNCIPFDLPKLRNFIPGVMKGVPITITASTGVNTCALIW